MRMMRTGCQQQRWGAHGVCLHQHGAWLALHAALLALPQRCPRCNGCHQTLGILRWECCLSMLILRLPPAQEHVADL